MKVALVTGGSSGIGAATARELAKRGWAVAINFSKNEKAALEVAKDCNGSMVAQGDVSRDADCRKVVEKALEKWGRIDALVNNAGTTKYVKHADLEGLSAEDFRGIFATNVVGPFQMVRACAAALKASRGAIVNVSSLAGVRGGGSSVAYAASKAALNTMTLSLARTLAPEVRVNAVCPGYVRTPWHDATQGAAGAAEAARRYASNAALQSVAESEDVADAIVWLIEGARMVTGQLILVDAGMHVGLPR
jgi:3-oxoacyl-[acyl-carrier protein] reductase